MTATFDPLRDVAVSETAREKRGWYLRPGQLRRTLWTESGAVYRRTSPNHDGLYDETRFILRGTFHGQTLDVVFVVEPTRVVVVTQTGQHTTTMRGRFYENVGETATDAVEWLNAR